MVKNDFKNQIESLRYTLGKMEVALGAISDAIVWTDAIGRIQWCNAAFDRLMGKPHITLLGVSVVDIMPLREHGISIWGRNHPVSLIMDRKSDKSGYYEFMRGEKAISLEIMGRYVEVGLTEASAVLVICDVTRAEELEQVKLQSMALEAAANAIVITDQKGCIIWFNQAFTPSRAIFWTKYMARRLTFLNRGSIRTRFMEISGKRSCRDESGKVRPPIERRTGACMWSNRSLRPLKTIKGKLPILSLSSRISPSRKRQRKH